MLRSSQVFGEFRVVDLPILASLLAREPEAVQRSAISWSIQWNRYVTCACAHAHFARRWSDLVRVMSVGDGGLLLKSTLRKINGLGDERGGLEPTVAKPLADVVLDLVGEVTEAGQEVDDGVVRGIAEAIGKVGEEELTGVLSSALTLSLSPSSTLSLPSHLISLSPSPLHLSLLSALAPGTAVPLAKVQSLASTVNTPVGIWTLTSIACTPEGAKNIEMANIPQHITSTVPPEEEDMDGGEAPLNAKRRVDSDTVSDAINTLILGVGAVWESNVGNVGGREMELFHGHLTLFECLMSSLPQSPTLRASACDFLRARGRTGVGVLKAWPDNGDVVRSYVRVLAGVSEGGGWKEGRVGNVGSKIEQGVQSLGLHICNFPLRSQALGGPRPPPSWYDPLNIPASENRGKALRGLDGRVDFFELDYDWALKGADVALGCLGFVRGMRGVLPVNGGVLSKAIETCVVLSRALKRKLEQFVAAHNIDPSKLPAIAESKFSWEDGIEEDVRIMVECKYTYLLGLKMVTLVENLLSLAGLQIARLKQAGEGLGGEGSIIALDGMAKSLLPMLKNVKIEERGIGAVNEDFAKKFARLLSEGCEVRAGRVGGEGREKGGSDLGEGLKVWGGRR